MHGNILDNQVDFLTPVGVFSSEGNINYQNATPRKSCLNQRLEPEKLAMLSPTIVLYAGIPQPTPIVQRDRRWRVYRVSTRQPANDVRQTQCNHIF